MSASARPLPLAAAPDAPRHAPPPAGEGDTPPPCAPTAEPTLEGGDPLGRVPGHPAPGPLTLPDEARAADVLILNTSAGKDSLAMLAAVSRAVRALPQAERPAMVAVHCDLGRVEWPGTRELAERQAAALGLPFVVVRRELGDLLDQVEQRGMWPSSTARYCTSDHKTAQVHKLMTRIAAAWRKGAETDGGLGSSAHPWRPVDGGFGSRPMRIVSALGLRAAESAGRSKRLAKAVKRHPQGAALELEKKPTGKGTRKVVHRWMPLHAWTAADVWAEVDTLGQADLTHPAYTRFGMPRLSCVFCIYAPRAALLRAGHAAPDLLETYAALETRIGHTFRQDTSIAEVAAAVAAGEQPGEIRTWEM